ncbi:hypothetical protein FHE66_03560 [Georgenia sp. 311]|uniref:SbsA Ig-like domain-containing protein n=1 Tax=Georgenia wutianyii TaxID=2585135 RepID=A0ABX5VMG2_9MICO|nr:MULTISPECIES: hypothetical protein [Georgenia]QDB79398.1 hypothetical protein FE251_08455 [Georgenia wutianyii]TNC19549.1 hypothetical protein FHE66_03560 [Georgenia sp. 311]
MTQHTTALAVPADHDRGDALPLLERNTYWHGKEMGVAEFQRDQAYFRHVQQTLTRLTVGCSVLCGLELSPHGTRGLAVAAGAAVDGHGRLVVVPAAVAVDDARTVLEPDCAPDPRGTFRLCLVHHECPTAPARVVVTDCDTRTECLPGAVREGFRLELRSHRPGCASGEACGCGTSPQGCGTDCGDCVTLGTVTLTQDAVAGVTADGRRDVVRNVDLAARLGMAEGERTEPPSLCRIWPPPGRVLSREGSPSEWGRWRQRPRVELTFDQPIDVDRVDDPDDWLRAWVATEHTAPDGAGTVTFTRVGLRFLPTASQPSPAGHRLVYEFRSRDARRAGSRQVVLLQARATPDSGPAAASPTGGIARIEYAGTPLTRDTRARIWRADRFTAPGTTLDTIMGSEQPGCFGDPYEGGRVHAVFEVAPVVAGATAVTAVHPPNASRMSGTELTVELAGTGPLDGLTPRAWIVGPDGPAELPLTAAPLPDGAAAAVTDRFPASFDATVHDELREVVRFVADMTGLDDGRVLVVVPAHAGEQAVGAFAGTCLTEPDVAHVYAHGPSPTHERSIRPTRLRMPRTGQTGAWIHWTFYWEHDDDDRS